MPRTHYIALVHKDQNSSYGVSFPDVPGVIAAGDTLEEALSEGSAVLAFAFEDWPGEPPLARTFEQLREDLQFIERSRDAIVAVVSPGGQVAEAAE